MADVELSTLSAPVKTAYEGNADTNAFTATEQTKLSGIETAATADQTGAEIKTAYELEADTNAFTDIEQTKLSGVSAGATVNSADATLLARANHTGVQAISTVTDLQTTLDGKLANGAEAATVATINGLITAGTNISISGAGTTASPYAITSSGGGGTGGKVFDGGGLNSYTLGGGDSIGEYSFAFGSGAIAHNHNCIAWGRNAVAGTVGGAIGDDAFSAEAAIAIGENAVATRRHGGAIGSDCSSTGLNSWVIGDDSTNAGEKCYSYGDSCTIGSGAQYSFLLGRNSDIGDSSFTTVMGSNTSAASSRDYQTVYGYGCSTNGEDFLAVGINTVAGSPTGGITGGVAVGIRCQAGDATGGASGTNTVAIGKDVIVHGTNTTAIGYDITTTVSNAFMFGNRTMLFGQFATGSLPTASLYDGGVVYDTTENKLKYSNGTAWVTIESGVSSSSWGSITGTLSSQTDLVSELTDAKARANHTGTQAISTVTGLQTALDGKQATITNSDGITEGSTNLFFTSAEQTKLSGIETAATADQTDGEIKTAYENNANTNAFTDAEQTKLTGVATSATANPTAPESDPTGVTGADAITNMMSLTQAEYDAITPNATTFYIITDAI